MKIGIQRKQRCCGYRCSGIIHLNRVNEIDESRVFNQRPRNVLHFILFCQRSAAQIADLNLCIAQRALMIRFKQLHEFRITGIRTDINAFRLPFRKFPYAVLLFKYKIDH